MATSRFFAVVAALAALANPLVPTLSAGGSRPLAGTGLSTETSSTVLSVRQAGPNIVIEQQNVREDVGAFTGRVDEHMFLTIHPDGIINLRAEAILSGTYPACGPESVRQAIHLEGMVSPDGVIGANFATTGGAAVPVQGTVEGSLSSPTANFEISYHC